MRHILEIGPEEHAGGLAMEWVEEMMAVRIILKFWPSWTVASSAEMGKTPWGRNGFGQGNQKLALGRVQSENPASHPCGVRYTVGYESSSGRSQLL